MNKISIGFSKPKTWKPLARLIQIFEGTKYSHVFVTWECSNIDRRKVFESVGSGTRILSNVTFKRHAIVCELYNFEVDDNVLFEIEQSAHDQAGRPYGYKALIGLTLMRFFNIFNRVFKLKGRQGNIFKDGDYSQVCVESAAMVLKKARPEINLDDSENFGLKEIHDIVVEHGSKTSIEKIERINKG
jgi:hypothetical protein